MLILRKICLTLISDFISLELERGTPRLLIDFGSGTLELRVKTKKSLDDGEWHRIDVFWDTEVGIIRGKKYSKNRVLLRTICL
jgi:hypothetical protein